MPWEAEGKRNSGEQRQEFAIGNSGLEINAWPFVFKVSESWRIDIVKLI